MQRAEQRERVLAARDADGDAVAVLDHMIVVHRAAHAREDFLQFSGFGHGIPPVVFFIINNPAADCNGKMRKNVAGTYAKIEHTQEKRKNCAENEIFLKIPLDKTPRFCYSKQAQTITMRKTEEYI